VDLTGELVLSGWAVDPEAKNVPGGVEIVIDKKPYRGDHSLSRQDVADFFKIPAYEKAGYRFSMPARLLGTGTHVFVGLSRMTAAITSRAGWLCNWVTWLAGLHFHQNRRMKRSPY
jgi:hypothetical protein